MKITNVKTVKITDEKNKKVRGVAAITIDDCIAVHNIKIVEGEKGFFISFPSRFLNGEYKDIIHPINNETRQYIQDKVLESFELIK